MLHRHYFHADCRVGGSLHWNSGWTRRREEYGTRGRRREKMNNPLSPSLTLSLLKPKTGPFFTGEILASEKVVVCQGSKLELQLIRGSRIRESGVL